MMTSKERMLSALHREKPDRLPVSVHQWQPYHLDIYLDGISDHFFDTAPEKLEVFADATRECVNKGNEACEQPP